MELQVGQTFYWNGKKAIVEKSDNKCYGCLFDDIFYPCFTKEIIEARGSCYRHHRTDNTDVIFREVKRNRFVDAVLFLTATVIILIGLYIILTI